MTTGAEKLMGDLVQLSETDRAEIAMRLIDTLHPEDDHNDIEAWYAELERRHDDVISGRDTGVDVDEVIARARALLS